MKIVISPSQPSQHNSEQISRALELAWKASETDLERRARYLTRGDHHRAADLLSTTALKTLLYLRNVPGRIRDIRGFLFFVLNHVFLDSVCKHKRDAQLFDYAIDVEADFIETQHPYSKTTNETLELHEQLTVLSQALHTLSAEQRHLFAMRFEDDLPYPDIAHRLNVSEALVRKRVQLLRQTLRRLTL